MSQEEEKTTVHYTPAGWVEAKRNEELFVCRCGDEAEKAEALVQEVMKKLGVEERDKLVSHVVMSLVWDYNASITGIYGDQWFGVSAQTGDGSFGTWVQCDWVEDGIAGTWKLFHEKFPEKSRKDEDDG